MPKAIDYVNDFNDCYPENQIDIEQVKEANRKIQMTKAPYGELRMYSMSYKTLMKLGELKLKMIEHHE